MLKVYRQNHILLPTMCYASQMTFTSIMTDSKRREKCERYYFRIKCYF